MTTKEEIAQIEQFLTMFSARSKLFFFHLKGFSVLFALAFSKSAAADILYVGKG